MKNRGKYNRGWLLLIIYFHFLTKLTLNWFKHVLERLPFCWSKHKCDGIWIDWSIISSPFRDEIQGERVGRRSWILISSYMYIICILEKVISIQIRWQWTGMHNLFYFGSLDKSPWYICMGMGFKSNPNCYFNSWSNRTIQSPNCYSIVFVLTWYIENQASHQQKLVLILCWDVLWGRHAGRQALQSSHFKDLLIVIN